MQYELNQFDESLLEAETVDQTPIETSEPENQENNDDAIEETHGDDETIEETPEVDENNLTAFESFLKSRGIRDGKTVVYENEDGETEEIDFSTLSKEEQLEILNSVSDPGLSEDEVHTINYLRQNNASLQDVITYFQQQAIDEYIKSQNIQPVYTVDDYTDDELYLADIKAKFPDMTEDEL